VTKNVNTKSWTFTGSPRASYDSSNLAGVLGISNVTGTIADGQTITISGGGFGLGPTNTISEFFDGGATGQDITGANSNFDTPNAIYPATFDTDSRSGTHSANMVSLASGVVGSINGFNLGSTTEVFVTYAFKVPSGAYFPGIDGGNTGTNSDYSSDSSWKMNWLLGPDSTTNDMISLSHVGGGIWHTGGNALGLIKNWGTDPTWFKWGGWNRVDQWFKAGATPNVDQGNFYTRITNDGVDSFEFSDTPVIFASGSAPYEWNSINFAGWMRNDLGGSNSLGAGVKYLYDDIYVAWGDNAAARVELGNNSVYENCTSLAICDSGLWADGSITATCREGGLDLAQNTWLFVTLADNTTHYGIQVVNV
jgi:hypothetical protein